VAVLTVLRFFATVIALGMTALAIACAEEIDASTPTGSTRQTRFPEARQWRAVTLERALSEAGKIEDPYRRAVTFAGIARARARTERRGVSRTASALDARPSHVNPDADRPLKRLDLTGRERRLRKGIDRTAEPIGPDPV